MNRFLVKAVSNFSHHSALGWINRLKSIAIIMFALLLFTGSACSKVKVDVSVHAPSSGGLTGTNCKLQRELRNHQQQTDYWCWAAAAQTVIEYLKQEPVLQCDLVQAVFRDVLRIRDPNSPDPGPSNPDTDPSILTLQDPLPHCCMVDEAKFIDPRDPWYVQKAAEVCWKNGRADKVFNTHEFDTYHLTHEYDPNNQEPQGLPWDEIVTEICEDRPIISSIAHDESVGGGGHAVVIGGYKELGDGSRWVQVYDPGYSTIGDSYVWLYEVYLGNPGVFTHVRDYTNISVRH